MKVTWWGHATVTIELDGVRILTDPVLTARVAHLSRIGGPTPPRSARLVDAVVISHLHGDHLHIPSLRMLPSEVPIIAPHGSRNLCPALAPRIVEVAPGDVVDVRGVAVRAVMANHDGRRLPRSKFVGTAMGFVLSGDGQSAWFAGDTGLFDEMSDIGPVDTAVVPVGGWGPTLGPHHLDPEQAAEAVRRVGARDAVPMHYGTLWPTGLRTMHPASFRRLFLEPGERFRAAVSGGLTSDGVQAHVIGPGQYWRSSE